MFSGSSFLPSAALGEAKSELYKSEDHVYPDKKATRL